MKYYIVAGEPSGDLHGGNLIRGLAAADAEAQFRFWGGDKMAEAGGSENLVKHYRELSFFGIMHVLRNLRTIFAQLDECVKDIEQYQPDVVVLVDYPSFNMRIAKWAKSRGIKVFYYIPPKVWAWKEHRVKSLRKYVDRLYAIFPFEQGYFEGKGIKPVYFGNPLVDAIANKCAVMPSREEFFKEYGLDERPVIALLAGSRKTEIAANLPDMIELSRRFADYQFVVAGVSWLDASVYREVIGGADVKVVSDKTYELLSHAEAAIVTSGTATLETALMNVPEIVVFRIPYLYEKLRPYVLKIPYVSLVNINLGSEVVREIITSRFDADAVAEELRSILPGGTRRESMLQEFAVLRRLMGEEGVARRAAADMVKTLKGE